MNHPFNVLAESVERLMMAFQSLMFTLVVFISPISLAEGVSGDAPTTPEHSAKSKATESSDKKIDRKGKCFSSYPQQDDGPAGTTCGTWKFTGEIQPFESADKKTYRRFKSNAECYCYDKNGILSSGYVQSDGRPSNKAGLPLNYHTDN